MCNNSYSCNIDTQYIFLLTDVKGAIFQIGTNFPQAGQVKVYNLTRELTRVDGKQQEIAMFEGDRKLGRYGQMVGMMDVDGDAIGKYAGLFIVPAHKPEAGKFALGW